MLKNSLAQSSFGSTFSDHMFVMEWNASRKWHNARIQPYQPLSIDPALITMHYGPSIFEGIKAYWTTQQRIAIFRPHDHFTRFNTSARRMEMPEIDSPVVLHALKELLSTDYSWIPKNQHDALYIRPLMIATEPTINLKISNTFLFYVILSPIQPMNHKTISVMVNEQYTRACIGGVGDIKTAGNYAASMHGQRIAQQHNFDHVLWLDSTKQYIEEMSSMNVFFLINDVLITPSLQGTILSGITRKSVIELAQQWNIAIVERPITIHELCAAIENETLTDAFGTGTAMGIVPIGMIGYQGKKYIINQHVLSHRFANALHDIQRERIADTQKWLELLAI